MNLVLHQNRAMYKHSTIKIMICPNLVQLVEDEVHRVWRNKRFPVEIVDKSLMPGALPTICDEFILV